MWDQIIERRRSADLIMPSTCRDTADLQRAAGAGMGVDSGLPDFRGTESLWRAYPAPARTQLRFESIASPPRTFPPTRRRPGSL